MYPYSLPQPIPIEKRWKPNVETAPNCPRCDSPNTKFCYYNNYSLTQPRYFCKACRRYWTKGGSLRNVPVGGGCRKNRRAKLSSKASSTGTAHFSRKTDGNCDGNNNGNGLYRPDLALDGMIGKCGTIDQKSSSIDLAAVYSKFVNPDMQVSYEMGSSSSSDQVNLSLASELENYSFDVYDNQALAFMEGEGELVSDFAWQEEEHKYHQGVSSELFSVLSAAHLHPH